MKKTLLIGSALVISFAGFSQSNANKVVNPKYTKGTIVNRKKATTEGPAAPANWQRTVLPNKTSSGACLTKTHLTSSWNANGVGGGADCVNQNCLSYNKDLNALMWYQRASKDWPLVLSSGGEQATIITNANPNVAG